MSSSSILPLDALRETISQFLWVFAALAVSGSASVHVDMMRASARAHMPNLVATDAGTVCDVRDRIGGSAEGGIPSSVKAVIEAMVDLHIFQNVHSLRVDSVANGATFDQLWQAVGGQ